MKYYSRHIESKLLRVKDYAKVLLLMGARQVGKTTLLQKLFPNTQCITFDPVQDLYGARRDPDLFLNNLKTPVILDEVQFVPQLMPALKRKVDNSDQKGQYFLTGSQNLNLLSSVSESLAGRVAIVSLGGMTPYEMGEKKDEHWLIDYLEDADSFFRKSFHVLDSKASLYSTLWRGGYPGLLGLPDEAVPSLLSSYIQAYVEKDVRLLSDIQNVDQFGRFLGIASALTAQEINQSHMGREIGVSSPTAERWLHILNQAYLWSEVMPYSGNAIKRISQKRKGYICDTGLVCYLQGVSSPMSLSKSPFLGAIFESFCVQIIKAISETLGVQPKLYHWRTTGGAEVDLILERDGLLFPIEFKCKSQPNHLDARGLQMFKKTYPNAKIANGLIIHAGTTSYAINDNILAIPWNAIKNK